MPDTELPLITRLLNKATDRKIAAYGRLLTRHCRGIITYSEMMEQARELDDSMTVVAARLKAIEEELTALQKQVEV